ncbi:hypothetical protein C5167_022387 [Papaver somniferum]|uniref:Uncharacterized protein n=1 Tax=Papaver somniferum TaxID=3469 RepID=A0A4Y7JLS7_PAPSO|nr:hypothetical protein C5167_022387 [Papaver somniferum]
MICEQTYSCSQCPMLILLQTAKVFKGVSVECDISMRASKVVGMIFLEEEENIVDLEVEVQCIKEVDRVLIMDRPTIKFMIDKGPSSNRDRSLTMGDIQGNKDTQSRRNTTRSPVY